MPKDTDFRWAAVRAPVKDVWNKARAMGITIVVESETQPDNITEVAACFEYLKSLENN